MKLFYVAYHIPSKTVHYRVKNFSTFIERLGALEALDTWNAKGRGTWQFYSVKPGFACPRDESRYTEVEGFI